MTNEHATNAKPLSEMGTAFDTSAAEQKAAGAAQGWQPDVLEVDGLRVGPAMLREFIADARRYRWLRRPPNNLDLRCYAIGLLKREEYLDAAIDAAAAPSPPKGDTPNG